MDKQYYLDCLNKGTKLYWHTLGKVRGMSLHTGDIEWVMSVPRGGVERIFNICLSHDHVNASLDALIDMIKKGEAPSGILITPNSKPDDITKILSSKGFTIDNTGSGMAMEINSSIDQIKFADNIEIILVENPEMLKAWVDIVNIALFEEELFSFEQFYDLFMFDNTYFYLGFFEGYPVSTCMTITEGDLVTVEMVSTLEKYRNNGLGTAVVTTALQEMKNIGVQTAILRSEEGAVNVYKRIGFKEFYKRIVANYDL